MAITAARATGDKPHFKSAFSSFSTDDIALAKKFYGETLGLDVSENAQGGLELSFDDGQSVFIYPKDDHEAATFTVLNLMVDDIAAAVDQLKAIGIEFESYGGEIATDDSGIFWGGRDNNGPNIAWFTDPAGNIIALMEE